MAAAGAATAWEGGCAVCGGCATGGGVIAAGTGAVSLTSGFAGCASATGTGGGGVGVGMGGCGVTTGGGVFSSAFSGVTSSGSLGAGCGAGRSSLTSTFGAGGTIGATRSMGGVGASALGIGGSSSSALGTDVGAATVTLVLRGASARRGSGFAVTDSNFGAGEVSSGKRCTRRALKRVLASGSASALGVRQPKLSPPT